MTLARVLYKITSIFLKVPQNSSYESNIQFKSGKVYLLLKHRLSLVILDVLLREVVH